MSHEIEVNQISGKAEIAYVGERAWHQLGQELQPGASIEQWVEAAQMDWHVLGSPVEYKAFDNVRSHLRVYNGQQVLYRSDTLKPLSVVSEDFKIVQPKEVLEFFRDLTKIHGMQLSVAGCLFNGKRFWATAETGRIAEILPGDDVRGQLLLMTGVDGTLATTAKFVSTRTVCMNTMQIALNETGGSQARRTHRQTFDAHQVKIDLGLLDGAWDQYIQNMKKLAATQMSDDMAAAFFRNLVATKKDDKYDNKMSRATKSAVDDLMHRLRYGIGADSGRGTAWNVINSVTEKYTHGTQRRNADRQFVNSMYGPDSNIKSKAENMLLTLA